MRFPTLTVDMPLSDLHREVRYTLAVLRQRPWAATRVPAFEGLLKDVAAAEGESLSLLDKLEDASAGVDEADLHLDLFVDATATDALQAVSKDTSAPLWRSLFGNLRPSQLTRPKLGDELEQVRTWPELLRIAPTQALRDRLAPCTARIKAADEALKARQVAQTALQVFKTSKLTALVARLNSERSSLAGESEKQLFDGKILPEASAGLFRSAARSRPARPETLASVQAELTATEQQLARLRERLAALQAEQASAEEAAARRRADQEALAALQAAQADSAQKIAELQRRLQN